jgi:hypothetical protein
MPKSTIGGDDPEHDLPLEEKNRREEELYREAVRLLSDGRHKERKKRLARAQEISRRKSGSADHH